MRLLPLVFLSACSQVDPELEAKCPEEVQALQQSCDLQNGTFKKTVDDARMCLGEQVRILCQDPGLGDRKILTIEPKNHETN